MALVAILALAGCTSGNVVDGQVAPDISAGLHGAVFGHVHGVVTDPGTGRILVATHLGLFAVDPGATLSKVGPTIDLMGFARGEHGRLLASGHPGPDSDLSRPAGLLESHDGGVNWVPVSRGGRSDFHVLVAYDEGVYGWDGSLLHSTDEQRWEALAPPSAGGLLAASPDGAVLLVGDGAGASMTRSTDAGRTWHTVPSPGPLEVLDWSDTPADVVAAGPDGQVWLSSDSGATWIASGQVDAPPQAAEMLGAGEDAQVTVVTAAGISQSVAGRPFVDITLAD